MDRKYYQRTEKGIGIVKIIEDAGVQLTKIGNKFRGLCPFHSENNPSFYIFPEGHYHCFGCQAHGDAIDFVRQFYGYGFKQALSYVGIDTGRESAFHAHREIEMKKIQRELVVLFQEWERCAIHHFSVIVRCTYKAMALLTPDNFDEYAGIVKPLSYWEYCLEILTSTNIEQKFLLFKEHHHTRVKLLRRNSLFYPDFNFRKWLRETESAYGRRV